MTFIDAITLSDAADAVRQTDVASYNASGFITDYKFSGEELWDSTSGDHTTISLTGVSNTAEYNDVTITPKPITISGVEVDDRIYDGGTSSSVYFGNVDWDSIGRVSGDNLDFDTETVIDADTFTGVFEDKDVSLSSSTVQDKTVNLTNHFTGDDEANYDITVQATTEAKIYPRPLGFNAEKTYDGTTTVNNSNVTTGGLAEIDGFADSGLVSGESLVFSVTASDDNVLTANKYAINTDLGLADSGSHLASNYTTTAYNYTLVSDGSTVNVPEFPVVMIPMITR